MFEDDFGATYRYNYEGEDYELEVQPSLQEQGYEVNEKWNCIVKSNAKELEEISKKLTKLEILNSVCYAYGELDGMSALIYRSMSSFKIFEGIVEKADTVVTKRKKENFYRMIAPFLYDLQEYNKSGVVGYPKVVLQPVALPDLSYVFRLFVSFVDFKPGKYTLLDAIGEMASLLKADSNKLLELAQNSKPIQWSVRFDSVLSFEEEPVSDDLKKRNEEFEKCILPPQNMSRAIRLLKRGVNILGKDYFSLSLKKEGDIMDIVVAIGDKRLTRYLGHYMNNLLEYAKYDLMLYVFQHDTRQGVGKDYDTLRKRLITYDPKLSDLGSAYVDAKLPEYAKLIQYYGSNDEDTSYESASEEDDSVSESISDEEDTINEDELTELIRENISED